MLNYLNDAPTITIVLEIKSNNWLADLIKDTWRHWQTDTQKTYTRKKIEGNKKFRIEEEWSAFDRDILMGY